jgi:hypothetical protein
MKQAQQILEKGKAKEQKIPYDNTVPDKVPRKFSSADPESILEQQHSEWNDKVFRILRRSPGSLHESSVPDDIEEVKRILRDTKQWNVPAILSLQQEWEKLEQWNNMISGLFNSPGMNVSLEDWVMEVYDTIQAVIRIDSKRECFCAALSPSDFSSSGTVKCPLCKIEYHRTCLKVSKTYELHGCPCCIIIPNYNPFKKPSLDELMEAMKQCSKIRSPEAIILFKAIQMLQNWLIPIEKEMKDEKGKEWQCAMLGRFYSLPVHIQQCEILEGLLSPSIQTPSWSRKRKSDSLDDQTPPLTDERDEKEQSFAMYHHQPDHRDRYYFQGYPDYSNYYSPYYPGYSQYYPPYYPYH